MPQKRVPNLIGGISQQAPQMRREGQCEVQWDCLNSALEGCIARPHFEFVKRYVNEDWTTAAFAEMYRGDEHYLMGVAADGIPFGIDLEDGTEVDIDVVAPDTDYIDTGADNPRDVLRFQPVDDYLHVVNTKVTPTMGASESGANVNEIIVWFRKAAYDMEVKISLSGPGSASSTQTSGTSTNIGSTIQLATQFQTALNGVDGYTVNRKGSMLRIRHSSGNKATIEIEEEDGDNNVIAYNGEAKSFEDLPERCFSNTMLLVRGDSKEKADDFWVKYRGDFSTGNWEEVVAPLTKTTINAATMPHALVNTGYRDFSYVRNVWSTRVAGDEETAKEPSFIGKKIRGMTYWNRRMGYMWNGGVCFSKTDYLYTMFPDTVQTVLATAPVDLPIPATDLSGSADLDFSLQAGGDLTFWAQRAQTRVHSNQEAFKQETAATAPTTAFTYSYNRQPLITGSFLWLFSPSGDFSALRSLQITENGLSGDVDVTSHVPNLIPGTIQLVTGNDSLRVLFIRAFEEPQKIYVLNWVHDGTQFVQTALNIWRIPTGQIIWMGMDRNILRCLIQQGTNIILVKADLTPRRTEDDGKAVIRLDYRIGKADWGGLSYNSTTGYSTFTVPWTPQEGRTMVVQRTTDSDGNTRGKVWPLVSAEPDGTITVEGDITGSGAVSCGMRIDAMRQESEFFDRQEDGVAIWDRLVVDRFALTMSYTAYTRIEVYHPNAGATKKTYVYEPRRMGSEDGIFGTPEPGMGRLEAPIGQEAHNCKILIINDSFLPSSWQTAAYLYTAVPWKQG